MHNENVTLCEFGSKTEIDPGVLWINTCALDNTPSVWTCGE